MDDTPVQFLGNELNNFLYIKRDDMIPYSFGGNKARKSFLFFKEFDKGNYDYVITYGSSHSNHCRVVSNMACKRNVPCLIIGPSEVSDVTYNRKMMQMFGAEIVTVPVEKVHDTIELNLKKLKIQGKNPFFIPGGGHGNIGTQAYVACYEEIKRYENNNNINFDYIFLASGTGTTQAGLICGNLINKDDKKIIGISIARKNPRGKNIVVDSVAEFLKDFDKEIIKDSTIFIDEYTGEGYGKHNKMINEIINYYICKHGIPFDSTYTGKAFYGMREYIKANAIKEKNILFIHTGGTPLFFDYLEEKHEYINFKCRYEK